MPLLSIVLLAMTIRCWREWMSAIHNYRATCEAMGLRMGGDGDLYKSGFFGSSAAWEGTVRLPSWVEPTRGVTPDVEIVGNWAPEVWSGGRGREKMRWRRMVRSS